MLRCVNGDGTRHVFEKRNLAKKIAVAKNAHLVGIISIDVCFRDARFAANENVETVSRIAFIDNDAPGGKMFSPKKRLHLGKNGLAQACEKRQLFQPWNIDCGARLVLVK